MLFSEIIVSEQQLFKNFFWYRSFRYVSYIKGILGAPVKYFFRAQISQLFLFSKMPVSESSKITVWEQHLFKKHFGKEDLDICLPYVKRYFKSTSEILSSSGLKELRFCCFQECWFQRDQRPKFENNTFSRIFSAIEVLGMCLPCVKRYFQEHQWSAFFSRAQIPQILLLARMLV